MAVSAIQTRSVLIRSVPLMLLGMSPSRPRGLLFAFADFGFAEALEWSVDEEDLHRDVRLDVASADERDDEIRQMLVARNARRLRHGRPELDVEAELRRLTRAGGIPELRRLAGAGRLGSWPTSNHRRPRSCSTWTGR